jgi:hypothetical protein
LLPFTFNILGDHPLIGTTFSGVLYQLRDIYSKCRFCFATFGFLKGEDIIFYERDIDEDVNMLCYMFIN